MMTAKFVQSTVNFGMISSQKVSLFQDSICPIEKRHLAPAAAAAAAAAAVLAST